MTILRPFLFFVMQRFCLLLVVPADSKQKMSTGRERKSLPKSANLLLERELLWNDFSQFPAGFFRRDDEALDSEFYSEPRLVEHIDKAAIDRLRLYYGEALREARTRTGGKVRVLDLCSSWISHLPQDLVNTNEFEVVGVGMNAAELKQNPVLGKFFAKDLNAAVGASATQQAETKILAPELESNSFDVVLNSVSVDYLTKPFAIFQETLRVLKPGGVAINTFSNRCFPSKAIRPWLQSDDLEHCRIVGSYFRTVSEGAEFRAGRAVWSGGGGVGWGDIAAFDISPRPGRSDPLYAVQARKVVEDIKDEQGSQEL